MQLLNLRLEDWQQAALAELARERGVEIEAMAESLLGERLMEHMNAVLKDLLCGLQVSERQTADTIEGRLKRLFEE
jgi:hypothetical protein